MRMTYSQKQHHAAAGVTPVQNEPRARMWMATFNCDSSSHFGGTQQAILYFEIWRDRVLVREYQTRDAWETASWTPQVWI